ncbi:MAG: KamA family radical SAM protein [Alphaproteobacteria bacterium]|nr:KamA family radical SAM protein [Alphaproteobacteria bacterium]
MSNSISNEMTKEFRRSFFPQTTDADWDDWRWQIKNRICDLKSLEKIFSLSNDERDALLNNAGQLAFAITPYYASLMDRFDPNDPLRITHIPVTAEMESCAGEEIDPLGEDCSMATPGLVHKYPDRALFLATNICAGYCRYCNRARMVSHKEQAVPQSNWDKALEYLRKHNEIRDVLISGGDPLMLGDEKIDWLLGKLREIKHIEFIRIGTKIPITLPQRITNDLALILKKYHPLWISVHVVHPSELTSEATAALGRLADAGLPIGSQTVLLKGVNDTPEIMKKLMHKLLINRVTPYALFQMDQIKGASRFRTSIRTGLGIISSLQGHTTGYAVPKYIIDPPGGGGKVQLVPNSVVGREGDYILLRNYQEKIYRYYDPLSS